MEIKLENGTTFIIEELPNAITVKRISPISENIEITTREGSRFILNQNLIYVM